MHPMDGINGNASVAGLLQEHGIRPTANRIMIATALSRAGRPLSMTELETLLETVDKSVVFRTLSLFKDSHLVHVMEDGGDGARYELCHSHAPEADDDLHAHFYCTICHRTYCLEEIPVPKVTLPGGFSPESANFMIKGICPECNRSGLQRAH